MATILEIDEEFQYPVKHWGTVSLVCLDGATVVPLRVSWENIIELRDEINELEKRRNEVMS